MQFSSVHKDFDGVERKSLEKYLSTWSYLIVADLLIHQIMILFSHVLSILTQSSHSPSFPPESSKAISTVSPCCSNLSQQPQPYTGIDWYILVYIGMSPTLQIY